MTQIFKILKKEFKENKNLNIQLKENKVVITKNFIFKIFLWEASKNKVNISYNWNFGFLGELIFNKDLKKMKDSIKKIENVLIKENIFITKIIKNNT